MIVGDIAAFRGDIVLSRVGDVVTRLPSRVLCCLEQLHQCSHSAKVTLEQEDKHVNTYTIKEVLQVSEGDFISLHSTTAFWSSAHLMFQEERSELSFRPEVHGIS